MFSRLAEDMKSVRERDPAAIEVLYDRYGRRAFGLAYRVLGDGAAAEDGLGGGKGLPNVKASAVTPLRSRSAR